MSLLLATLLVAQSGGLGQLTVGDMVVEAKARLATIDALLGAMAHHDQKTFKAVGGDKIAFSSDPDQVFAAVMAPRTPRLAIDSFAALASCKPHQPQSTSVDWYSVSWDCPVGTQVADTQFHFKFAGRSLVAIQAGRHAPRFKIN